MKTLSLFSGILCSMLLLSCLGKGNRAESADNGIRLGTARVEVRMNIGEGDTPAATSDSMLDAMEIFGAVLPIYAYNSEYIELVRLQREGNVFSGELPVDRVSEIGGVRVYVNGDFCGGTMLMLDQNMPAVLDWRMSVEGFPIDLSYHDASGMQVRDWMSASRIFEEGIAINPPRYISQDSEIYKQPWKEVRAYETDTLWPRYLQQTLGSLTLPPAGASWMMNNLRTVFAVDCILPYQRYAAEVAHAEVQAPPMEAYTYLDSLDYSPDIYLLNNMNLSQRVLPSRILDVPAGDFGEIGNMPLELWRESVSRKMEPAMKETPRLLLDLLAGMSYIRQIEAEKPLTDTQINNIKEGFPDDIGKIVLAENDRLLEWMKQESSFNDLTAEAFDLKEYIDSAYQGRPVVVDFCNIWLDPAYNALVRAKDLKKDFAGTGLASLTVARETPEQRFWKTRGARIGGDHLMISVKDFDAMEKSSGASDPMYTMFFDKDHKLVHVRNYSLDDSSYIDYLREIAAK